MQSLQSLPSLPILIGNHSGVENHNKNRKIETKEVVQTTFFLILYVQKVWEGQHKYAHLEDLIPTSIDEIPHVSQMKPDDANLKPEKKP